MDEQIEELISKFKEPKFPYVLFVGGFVRFEKNEADGTSKFERYLDEFLLDCSGCHAHPEKIRHYMSKGWRIVKWKLPVNDKCERIGRSDPFKASKTEFDPERDHFEELAKYIVSVQEQSKMLSKDQQREFERTKKELAEMREKVAKANKKTSKPGDDNNE